MIEINKNLITQGQFIALFPSTRFRYIHDVNKAIEQGTDMLDMSWNKNGYGVFYTVNGFPPSGKADQSQLLSLNANYVDFDVVVTDLKMPGMDGMEVLKTIKILQPDKSSSSQG